MNNSHGTCDLVQVEQIESKLREVSLEDRGPGFHINCIVGDSQDD